MPTFKHQTCLLRHLPVPALALGLSLMMLSGCSLVPGLPTTESLISRITPYRMDIVQGNVVTQDQAVQVKPGMTRAQVRDILGSPMLTDAFHADRWDYVFTIRRQGTEPQQRSVVAHFKCDQLLRLDAPELPTEQAFVAAISRARASRPMPLLELSDAQKQALPRPPKVDAPIAEPIGAVRSYPPLEPS